MKTDQQLKIGSNLRQWRLIMGMKQREVAKKLGVSEAALSYIENDYTNPSLHQLEKLSGILGISVIMLIEGPHKMIAQLLSTK